MTARLEIVFSDHENVFARQGSLLVQVRRGGISVELIERIGAAVQRMVTHHHGPSGFIAVLDPTAETVSLAVRQRQRRIVRSAETSGDVKMALVVVGEGVQAALSRTIARALMLRAKRLRVAQDVDDAARWVAPHIGVGVLDVVGTVQQVRRAFSMKAHVD